MNVYPKEFIEQNEVKDQMFRDKRERDTLARQLRKEGWQVECKKYFFEGDERFAVFATRRREG